MGLMETVKLQATQVAEKAQQTAQQAGEVGQAKVAEIQAKRKADGMLLELGKITYREQTGRGDPTASVRAAELVGQLEKHEAEHGAVVASNASAGSSAKARPVRSSGPGPSGGSSDTQG